MIKSFSFILNWSKKGAAIRQAGLHVSNRASVKKLSNLTGILIRGHKGGGVWAGLLICVEGENEDSVGVDKFAVNSSVAFVGNHCSDSPFDLTCGTSLSCILVGYDRVCYNNSK